MHPAAKSITVVTRAADYIAGFLLLLVMGLVVANVALRVLFNGSILGTYEMVGYLTAASIGLALASCAVQNGHLAIELIVHRLPPRARKLIGPLFSLPAALFLLVAAYQLGRYGQRVALSGEVAPTTGFPFHPFIYLVAFGFFILGLVELVKAWPSVKGVAGR
ncbi:MAG TPA: TRAP transporter small permease [Bacillota bacterium]|nr:TRAP transporter small permease [Bacillota bacterium]HOP68912.1 TRAP transporter small permease [Bacillota bacterium]HPT33419.1 TRAP transporter small permease [Bacillota bacterium]HPZ64051.1 TRAP transporter small permease [Bacillota bacterium]HQD05369.1 TRAP transporter small permease [Bacillota bacterium]